MTWKKELEELRKRQGFADKMGGADKVKRQKERGKLTARQRLSALLDPGSFREIGKIAGKGLYERATLQLYFRARANP